MTKIEVEYPKSCSECTNHGTSDITCFPSLCKRNYLWFQCGGKFGIKKKDSENSISRTNCVHIDNTVRYCNQLRGKINLNQCKNCMGHRELKKKELTGKYFAIYCFCSIEVRPYREDKRTILTKSKCPRCNGAVKIKDYDNVLTSGYSDYEGEYLFESCETDLSQSLEHQKKDRKDM